MANTFTWDPAFLGGGNFCLVGQKNPAGFAALEVWICSQQLLSTLKMKTTDANKAGGASKMLERSFQVFISFNLECN